MAKMPLHELNGEPRATLGDGKNFESVQYRDVPQGFRIRDVTHRLTDRFVTVPSAFRVMFMPMPSWFSKAMSIFISGVSSMVSTQVPT